MKLEDIIVIQVGKEMLTRAEEYAEKLTRERKGKKTRGGGVTKDIKGCLAQEAVHIALDRMFWSHEYIEPYQKDQFGDDYDIKVADEKWDVKCRGKWSEEYFYNIELLVAEHEEPHKCDHYIFCTVDEDFENVYILGAISYIELWSSLSEPEEYWDNACTKPREYLFPTAGYIRSHELKPFKQFVVRT